MLEQYSVWQQGQQQKYNTEFGKEKFVFSSVKHDLGTYLNSQLGLMRTDGRPLKQFYKIRISKPEFLCRLFHSRGTLTLKALKATAQDDMTLDLCSALFVGLSWRFMPPRSSVSALCICGLELHWLVHCLHLHLQSRLSLIKLSPTHSLRCFVAQADITRPDCLSSLIESVLVASLWSKLHHLQSGE